ncbi:MAG: sensor histidine kinase [Gemmatimonadaceae bacterium]
MSAPRIAPEHDLLAMEKDRAERRLNAVRAIVVLLLSLAAAAYAPALSVQLNVVNVVVLGPMLSWTVVQYALFYRRKALPSWLAIVNPLADIAAVTVTMGGYGLEAVPPLALKSPVVLAYCVILAARPIASSVRKTAIIAVLVVLAYAALDAFFLTSTNVVISDPLAASTGAAISLLDESAKVVLLAIAGGIATYATWWHEQLARNYSAEARERESLQARLATSRLDSLKQQLQPHFLFNALNAITALVHTDPHAAERMILGLGQLIRVSLEGGGDQEVPLDRELTVLGHYIAIQQIRFEDRLTINMEVDDAARDALVPALILQPLVENAIRHGLAPRAAPGYIKVRALRSDDHLLLSVSDNGRGLQGEPVESIVERVGIGNARARLTYLYGDQSTFFVDAPADGGFAVHMTIPCRTTTAIHPLDPVTT